MSQNKEEFSILKVIELARIKKYETTVAGFGVLDRIEKIDIPKKLKNRKIAVQALHTLSEGLVKYDYFTPEKKKELLKEANRADAPYRYSLDGFSNSAPKTMEETEEEYIPQEEPGSENFDDDDDDYSFDDDLDSEDDSDFEDEDEEVGELLGDDDEEEEDVVIVETKVELKSEEKLEPEPKSEEEKI